MVLNDIKGFKLKQVCEVGLPVGETDYHLCKMLGNS